MSSTWRFLRAEWLMPFFRELGSDVDGRDVKKTFCGSWWALTHGRRGLTRSVAGVVVVHRGATDADG